MRLVISALLALALGLLPAGIARAQPAAAAPPATMSCHGMGSSPEAPSQDMQTCAEHCLSQVNAQAHFARTPGPSLQNVITAPLADTDSASKPRLKEAPDPPPPRV